MISISQWRREIVCNFDNHGLTQTAFTIKPNWLYTMVCTDIQMAEYDINIAPDIVIITPIILYSTMIEENFRYIRIKCNSDLAVASNSLTFVCLHT